MRYFRFIYFLDLILFIFLLVSGYLSAQELQPPNVRLNECEAVISGDSDPDRIASAYLEIGIIKSFCPGFDRNEGFSAFQKIISDFSKSRWADDALWYLGKSYLYNLHDENKAILAFQTALDKYSEVRLNKLSETKDKPPEVRLRDDLQRLKSTSSHREILEAQFQSLSDPQNTAKSLFALADTQRRLLNFPQAVKTYQQIIQKYPDYAPQAQFEISETYFNDQIAFLDELHYSVLSDILERSIYETAITQYQEILKAYPTSEYAPQALYRIAQAYMQMGEYAIAKETCNDLQSKYPENIWSVKAKELSTKADSEYRADLAMKDYAEAYAVVDKFCKAWQNKDYGLMYSYLSEDLKGKESREEFTRRYELYGSQLIEYILFSPIINTEGLLSVKVDMKFSKDVSPYIVSGINRFSVVVKESIWKVNEIQVSNSPPELLMTPDSHPGKDY